MSIKVIMHDFITTNNRKIQYGMQQVIVKGKKTKMMNTADLKYSTVKFLIQN